MEVLRSMCRRVAAVRLGWLSRWARGAQHLAAGRTATEGLFASRRLRRVVSAWSEETRFDAVVVFCSSMAQYLDVPGLAGVPAVIDLVDVDSQKWLDYAARTYGVKRWVLGLEGRRLRRLETALADRAAAITLVSGAEADLYRSFCGRGRLLAVPNGVDLEYFRPCTEVSGGGQASVVFVGALDYHANIDGVEWFCREVWPEVQRQRIGSVFRIIGSRPAPRVRSLGRLAGVEVVGEVADVRPFLAAASMVVAPLRVARGIQNKVLEALAMGKAVIASRQALEGLDVEPGVHAWEAVSAGAWVDGITSLFEHPEVCSRLGRAGRERMESHYRWEDRLRALDGVEALGNVMQGVHRDDAAERHERHCVHGRK